MAVTWGIPDFELASSTFCRGQGLHSKFHAILHCVCIFILRTSIADNFSIAHHVSDLVGHSAAIFSCQTTRCSKYLSVIHSSCSALNPRFFQKLATRRFKTLKKPHILSVSWNITLADAELESPPRVPPLLCSERVTRPFRNVRTYAACTRDSIALGERRASGERSEWSKHKANTR